MMVHDYHVLSDILIFNGVGRFGSRFRWIQIKNVDKVENGQYTIKIRLYLAVAYATELGVSTKVRRQVEGFWELDPEKSILGLRVWKWQE